MQSLIFRFLKIRVTSQSLEWTAVGSDGLAWIGLVLLGMLEFWDLNIILIHILEYIPFLAYCHYFEKIKVGLWDCLPVCIPHQLLNAWTNLYEICYVMAPESISTAAYFINPWHQTLCVSLLGNSSLNVCAATNRRNNKIVGRIVFYVSKESLWVCLCIPCHC
jgi:hypothetical protein